MLGNYSWTCGLSWSVVGITSNGTLKKTGFPFMNDYQLQTVSWLVVEPHLHFSLSVLGPCLAWTCTGLMCSVTVSVSSVLRLKKLFPRCHLSFLALTIFHFPLPLPESWMEGFDDTHLGQCASKSLTVCTLSICGSLYEFPCTTRRRVSDVGWERQWSMGTAVCHQ